VHSEPLGVEGLFSWSVLSPEETPNRRSQLSVRRSTPGHTIPISICSLAALILITPAAAADTLPSSYRYESSLDDLASSTTGNLGVLTIGGSPPGNLSLNTPFPLADLVVHPIAGQNMTYSNADVLIELNLPQFNTQTPIGPPNPDVYQGQHHQVNRVLIHGTLNGTVSGTGATNLTITFDPAKVSGDSLPMIPEDTYAFTFPFPTSDVKLPSSLTLTAGPGQHTFDLSAEIDGTPIPIPAPEPGTLTIFASAMGVLRFCRRHRALRAA
jgi:hypothetical protein